MGARGQGGTESCELAVNAQLGASLIQNNWKLAWANEAVAQTTASLWSLLVRALKGLELCVVHCFIPSI